MIFVDHYRDLVMEYPLFIGFGPIRAFRNKAGVGTSIHLPAVNMKRIRAPHYTIAFEKTIWCQILISVKFAVFLKPHELRPKHTAQFT